MKEEKENKLLEKKQRQIIKDLSNRILSQFSFRNVKTWYDVYKFVGYDDEYIRKIYFDFETTRPVLIKELKDYLNDLRLGVECQIWLKNNPPERIENDNSRISSGNNDGSHHQTSSSEDDKLTSLPISSNSTISREIKSSESLEIRGEKNGTEQQLDLSSDNNYGFIASEKEQINYFYWQKKACVEGLKKINDLHVPAFLVLASTGAGKTMIAASFVRRLIDQNFCENKTWGLTKILYVAKVTLIDQIKDDFKLASISCPDDCEVINIEQLRVKSGEIWINRKRVIVNGEEQEIWEWKKMIHPVIIIWDECQGLKNEGSVQSKIAVSFSDLPNTLQIYMSATPFGRVCEARSFCIATHKDISHITGIANSRLSASTWPTYAQYIAGSQSSPDDYNEAAVERLRNDLDNYIVQVRGMKWQFNARNHVEVIDFEKPCDDNDHFDSWGYYDSAWRNYLAKLEKLKLSPPDNPQLEAMVQLGIFLAAAEYSKIYIFARRAYENIKNGYAAFLGVKFKKTIIGVVKILVEKYHIPRDQISLIWGGGQTALTAKQKLKIKMRENEDLLKQAGITLEDMDLDGVEDRVMEELPKHLRLGIQTKEQRQIEIRKYQSGKALVAIYTYKAGGVGLSLPHTDRYTAFKCRRKANGYAYVEDIPKVSTRPRKGDIGPTWSPIELIQGAGRTARVISLSDTDQSFIYYKGTVEEDQALVVMHRLRCHGKVVRQQESWTDLIVNYSRSKEIAKEYVADYEKTEMKDGEQPEMDMDMLANNEQEEE